MAKGKKKAAKFKLPKRIGGVKIPKSVRKGEIGALLSSPPAQAMLAETLLMATAALAGHESHPGSKTRRGIARPVEKIAAAGVAAAAGKGAPSDAADRLRQALGEAVRAFSEALSGDDARWPQAPQETDGSKKKPRLVSDETTDLRH